MSHLSFLHTADVHVETFGRLTQQVDASIAVRHAVRSEFLAEAVAAGRVTAALRSQIQTCVQDLVNDGASVVVTTCSTIGRAVEEATVTGKAIVLRIDRPMAEQAVQSGLRIVVVAALASTFEPTLALLRQVAKDQARSIEIRKVLCEKAWARFEAGDRAAYVNEIVETVERTAQAGQIVVLAQASMAPAAERFEHSLIPVLASPRLGVRAAMARFRADDR